MPDNPVFLIALISKGIITEEDSHWLSQKYKNDTFAILIHLAHKKGIQREKLGRLWGDLNGFSYVKLAKNEFQQHIVQKLPEKVARKNRMIFMYQFGEIITAATSTPLNSAILRMAENIAGVPISPVFSFPDEIENAIEIEYKSSKSVQELSDKISFDSVFEEMGEISLERLTKLAGNEAIIKLAKNLFLLGIKKRASDIHIEPGEKSVRVRFRIDGVLHEILNMQKIVHIHLTSRIKILAGMNIVEKRKPQDGRFTFPLLNKSIDFRVSSIPSIFGEKIVLRILGQISSDAISNLEELNFSKTILKKLQKLIQTPNGVFFVTGPTGSGKTTTLYTILKDLNKPEVNITTIEDPVEYKLSGITQVQANSAVNLDFSTALKSFLRQDPDIILVGEVRDLETAKMTSQAALTGHLVMSTMHTNDSIQAVTRLIEIGVEPFLVAPSVIGVLAQRLVRKICKHCKKKYKLSAEEIEKMFVWDGKKEVFFYRGEGCAYCNQSGYLGRIGIHELFILNDKVRFMVSNNPSILDIKNYAKENHFQTLRYDGIKKALRGLTTMEEVNRVTVIEDNEI